MQASPSDPAFPDSGFPDSKLQRSSRRPIKGFTFPIMAPTTPFVPAAPTTPGPIADTLADWVADEDFRNRILADNPARLYEFR